MSTSDSRIWGLFRGVVSLAPQGLTTTYKRHMRFAAVGFQPLITATAILLVRRANFDTRLLGVWQILG